MAEFTLSCELLGHEDDVRGVCAMDDAGSAVATSSRDKTVRVWRRAGSSPHFTLDSTLVGHKAFVGPVACDPRPSPSHPQGRLVSGGMDSVVMVWDVLSGSSTALQGHQQQVTALAIPPRGSPDPDCIVSASVDRSIRVWREGRCVRALEGHESSVLGLVVRGNGDIYSGSGDCTIRCWRDGQCMRSFKAHSDTVRSLAEMPGLGLLSASHDGSVKLWDWEGTQLLEMVGHTALVYSVAAAPSEQDGVIASGSEDNTVRVWRNGACQQVLEHPGCVWAVAFLPNGDLLTGCADGVARVWTRDPTRAAPQEARERFEDVMRAAKRSRTVGGVKVEDLPGKEALEQPGRKDGQTKIIREGDVGVAYSWNTKEYNWDRIGEVVEGPSDPAESRTINGVVYDYVFDVDIGDGVPVRKLPYNAGDNPYDVADRWLLAQDLPLGYREQVVQFILQNTGRGAANLPLGNTIPDPYTGGQAYVPQASASGAVIGRPGATTGTTLGPPTPSPAPKPSASLPKRTFLVFDSAQYDGILKKLKEFNSALEQQASGEGAAAGAAVALGLQDEARLEAIVSTLRDTSHYHSSTFAPADVQLLERLLASWPASSLFPLLDVLRLMLLHPSAAALLGSSTASGSGEGDIILPALRRAAQGSPPLPANTLTGLRVAVNAFRHLPLFTQWLSRNRMEILDLYSGSPSSANKNVRVAFATLLLNFSLLLAESKDEEGQVQVLSAACEAAGTQEQDPTARQRALLALATLMQDGTVKQLACDMDAPALFLQAQESNDKDVAALGATLVKVLGR